MLADELGMGFAHIKIIPLESWKVGRLESRNVQMLKVGRFEMFKYCIYELSFRRMDIINKIN